MRVCSLFVLCMGACLPAGGCQNQAGPPLSYGQPELNGSADIVQMSVEAIGGLEQWNSTEQITATAVVKVYNGGGQALVSRQNLQIYPRKPAMLASGQGPKGRWQASVSPSRCEFDSSADQPSPRDRKMLEQSLQYIVCSAGGPLNLLHQGVRAGKPSLTRQADMELLRVPVEGDPAGALAYYFEPSTGMLKLVTVGGDEAGMPGSVTMYDWAVLPGGLSFPRSIRVIKIGQSVLVSDQVLLEAEFSDITSR